MLSRHQLLLIVTPLMLYATLVTAQQSVKDHPLVSRFPGSAVLEHKTADFDEFLLPLGKIIDASKFTKSEKINGKVTRFKYSIPENASTLVVAKSYPDAPQKNGFHSKPSRGYKRQNGFGDDLND